MPCLRIKCTLNPRLSVEVNGQAVAGAESTAHYIRKLDGHNESSGSLVAMLNDLAVDDVVTVSVHREGNGGVVTAQEDGLVSLQYRGTYSGRRRHQRTQTSLFQRYGH